MALAAISCSDANEALANLIKTHARKMEAGGFGKGYLCVFKGERQSEREKVLSLMLEIKDEN